MTAGRRSRRDTLDIFWAAGPGPESRLGLIVPKFRENSVARNRLRRRLKEIWRRDLQALLPPDTDMVVRARPATYRASFGALKADMVDWLTELRSAR